MPKVAKKPTVKKVVTLEELNKPIPKRSRPKVKHPVNWFKTVTLLLITVIAVSTSYIAYELKNTSYRISTYNSSNQETNERSGAEDTQ